MIRISLDKILEKRGITRYELAKRMNTHYPAVDKYYKNKVARYDSYLLLKMCAVLDCGIEDIIEVTLPSPRPEE